MMKKNLPVILIISVIIASGCTSTAQNTYTSDSLPEGVPSAGEHPVGNAAGDRAPDFTLTTTDGRTIKLSELTAQRKPVVLYFMATWCPYCKEEYKEIEQVFPGSGVEFISVSLDIKETAGVLENYRTSNNRPGTFATGSEQILKDYNVIYTTTN